MKIFIALSLLLFSISSLAQREIPQDYFNSPLDVDLVLSGTFGELRSNHFHSGLDIKTQQREGLPVYAAAEGFVSRINISHYGYGKALYIQHPNGYTTVYAHLQKLGPELEEYIKDQQYKRESYQIELFPSADELRVEKGQVIAYSGNTGGSGGPHLHFEIRDGQQRPMNPLMFGYEISDKRAPIVNSVFVYPLGEEAHVNGSAERQKLNLIPQSDGSYKAQKINACGEIGFGISTVDQLDMAPNRNGVFRIESSVNGNQILQANFEKFSFDETRHLNQLIDYEYYSRYRSRIQKLFVEPSNPLSIFSAVTNRGYVDVKDSLSYNYTIRVTDFAGNERVVHIPIEGKYVENISSRGEDTTAYLAYANEATVFEENGIDVYIPRNSLYQNKYLDVAFSKEKVSLHRDDTPLHSNITIGFDVSQYAPEDREQLIVARLSPNGYPIYSTTYREGDRLYTKTRTFGDYTITSDTTPPRIVPVNFKNGQWISSNKDLKVKISDNLSGIKDFKATVNGKFILMEYEYKQNLLTHDFADGIVTDSENNLEITVTDNAGNRQTYTATFFRKQ